MYGRDWPRMLHRASLLCCGPKMSKDVVGCNSRQIVRSKTWLGCVRIRMFVSSAIKKGQTEGAWCVINLCQRAGLVVGPCLAALPRMHNMRLCRHRNCTDCRSCEWRSVNTELV